MITKMPWKHKKHGKNAKNTAYNPRKNQTYILTDEHYQTGKTLLDAAFETRFAPLITINQIKCWIIPQDGDPQNTKPDNMLVAGPGSTNDVTREEAEAGNILRVLYTPEDEVYSYVFVRDGQFEEIRTKSFGALRNKCSKINTNQLINKKHLLTPQQYMKLYKESGGCIDAWRFVREE